MIEFETWISQIAGYCNFVSDEHQVRKAWISRDFSDTSVTDFDELYEQIFDDLDSNSFMLNLDKYLPNADKKRNAITQFILMLQEMDRIRIKNSNLLDASLLIASDQWKCVQNSALDVLHLTKYEAS
jgi:hypothetical protein